MISPLLPLAQAAAAPESGSLAEKATQIAGDFGLHLNLFVAQCFNFVVVAFLLWRFAFKPVLATIAERQEKIDSGLKYAEEMKAKLEASQLEIAAQVREAQVKGQQIIADAQKAAKEFSDRQQKDAAERANGIITKAQAAIELEKTKMLAEARTEISRLVVATAERVLAREMSEHDRARYNEAAAREITNV